MGPDLSDTDVHVNPRPPAAPVKPAPPPLLSPSLKDHLEPGRSLRLACGMQWSSNTARSRDLRSIIDDRLRGELGGRYDRHCAESVGTDKLMVTFTLRAATHADAIRSAGMAAGTLAELLTDNAVGVDV